MYLYTGKDGRQRLSFKNESGKLITISYPRFIMEQHIGRKLSPKEDVHHIDGNPLNNDISNLKIIPRGKHQREHSTKYYDKIEKCDYCGNVSNSTYSCYPLNYGGTYKGSYTCSNCKKSNTAIITTIKQ